MLLRFVVVLCWCFAALFLEGCQNVVGPSNANIDYAARYYCPESIDTSFMKIRSQIREICINKGIVLFLLFYCVLERCQKMMWPRSPKRLAKCA